MLFSLRSIALSSSSIAISPLVCRPVAAVPPPAALLPAEPVVIDDPAADDPDELAVPALLVPGGGCETTFPELPAPLGSLPVPADGPLAAPPALPPPLWASEPTGPARTAIAIIDAVTNILAIRKSPFR